MAKGNRREKDIDLLIEQLIETVNNNLSGLDGGDLSMADGLYVAASALSEVSATVMFDKLPLDMLHNAEGIFEMWVKITRNHMEEILDEKRGKKGKAGKSSVPIYLNKKGDGWPEDEKEEES